MSRYLDIKQKDLTGNSGSVNIMKNKEKAQNESYPACKLLYVPVLQTYLLITEPQQMHSCKPVGLICLCTREHVGCLYLASCMEFTAPGI